MKKRILLVLCILLSLNCYSSGESFVEDDLRMTLAEKVEQGQFTDQQADRVFDAIINLYQPEQSIEKNGGICVRYAPKIVCHQRMTCRVVCSGAAGGIGAVIGGTIGGGIGVGIGSQVCQEVCSYMPDCITTQVCAEWSFGGINPMF